MFGLRSAQGRAIAAGALGLVVLASVTALAVSTTTAEGTAGSTLWLLVGLSAGAFAMVAATVVGLIVWTVRPLAALRASARAIAAGDAEARAKVSGPEEVASLARDFNEMTDALSARVEELRASREMLETTTQGITDSILLLSRDLEIVWANKAGLRETGHEIAEVLGKRCYEVTHGRESPCDGRLDPCPIHELQKTDNPVTVAHTHSDSDGKEVFIEVSAYPIRDEQGEIVQFVHVSRDISERKRAEEALRESEQRYRLLAENATDVIWTMDTNLRLTYVSPSVTRLRGYTVQEAMNQMLKEMLTPASLKVAKKAIATEQAIEESETKDLSRSRTVEVEQTCKDGSTVWVEGKFAILRDPDGQAIGTLGITRDVTERKRAEEALRESEEKYRRLVQDSLDGIMIAQGLEMRLVNPALLEMFGCQSEEEMVGRPITEFISPEYRELLVQRGYAREKGQDEPERYEYKALRKDGSEFYAEISVTRITYQGKAARHGIVRDVSQRKRAEEALRESERRFRRLSGATFEGLVIHERGNILDANPAFARMFGHELSEVIGMHALDFTAPESRDLLWQGILSRREEPFEALGLRKDGSTLPCELRGKDIPYQGRMATVTAVRDITERKRTEEALQQAREDIESRVERRMQEVNGYGLTFRELTVLHLVAGGKADKEIATVLGISPRTVHKHLANILDKMGAASRTEAGVRALREGLLD